MVSSYSDNIKFKTHPMKLSHRSGEVLRQFHTNRYNNIFDVFHKIVLW